LLLKRGASFRIRNRSGETPLMQVAKLKHRIESMEALINEGASVNELEPFGGETALMYAVKSNNIDAVKLLLDSMAQPNIENRLGQTALNIAINYGHEEIAELLGKYGGR